jgi:hypothetical protein
MKIILITWKDTTGIRGPLTAKEIKAVPVLAVQTVGFLVSEDDTSLRVASQTDGKSFRNISIIPREFLIGEPEVLNRDTPSDQEKCNEHI